VAIIKDLQKVASFAAQLDQRTALPDRVCTRGSGRAAPQGGSRGLSPKRNNMYSFVLGRYVQVMTCSVLLDLDGTLIDSQPGILASCLAALRALDALSGHRSKT
jgi:hypothetical protein